MSDPAWLGSPRRLLVSKKALIAALTACLFLLIVGAKWATFDRFGSPMPDWDQWDAEALELLVPWYEHDHFVQHLFTPHNEHRVVLTKLQNLALTVVNGQWDSRLEAVTNALLHAALAVALWTLARRWVAARWHAALFALAFALFGLPLAWQNILGGFHSQQYWLLGLSCIAIVTLPFARTWSSTWWLGAAGAVLALGSMGSGFLAATVVAGVVGWRVLGRETTWRAAWPTLLLAAGVTGIGLLTRVEVYYHQQLKAKTAHDFIFSILRSLEWPLRDHDWAGAILWLPWCLVAWHVLLRGRTSHQPDAVEMETGLTTRLTDLPALTIAALGGWVLGQIVATAYARGAGADYPASRYMDTLTFGAMVNGTALAWCLTPRASGAHGAGTGTPPRGAHRIRGFLLIALSLAWVAALGIGLRDILTRNLGSELPDAGKYYANAEFHLRRYLATNDPRQLAFPDIPYPSADGLVERLAHPSLRALMPIPVRAPIAVAPGAPAEFAENDARAVDLDRPGAPRLGLSPATAPLDSSVSWGSFGATGLATTGEWKSAPLQPGHFGWLKFETAGDVAANNPSISLTLQDARSGAVLAEIRPTKIPGDTWRAAYVPMPRQPYVIVARDRSASHWLAFSPPVEMGGPGYWAWQATKNGRLIVDLAASATALLTLALWVLRRTGPAPLPSTPGASRR